MLIGIVKNSREFRKLIQHNKHNTAELQLIQNVQYQSILRNLCIEYLLDTYGIAIAVTYNGYFIYYITDNSTKKILPFTINGWHVIAANTSTILEDVDSAILQYDEAIKYVFTELDKI